MADVVQLRDMPKVSDIPGQLRAMADRIEAGEQEAESVLFIIPQTGDYPAIFGWGESMGDQANILTCELAKAWFIREYLPRQD
jgi:hypothetical protein